MSVLSPDRQLRKTVRVFCRGRTWLAPLVLLLAATSLALAAWHIFGQRVSLTHSVNDDRAAAVMEQLKQASTMMPSKDVADSGQHESVIALLQEQESGRTLESDAATLDVDENAPASVLVEALLSRSDLAPRIMRSIILRSGFGIRQENGQLTDLPVWSHNSVFSEAEIHALAIIADDGTSIQLEDLGRAIQDAMPGLSQVSVSKLLLSDLQRMIGSDTAEIRFLAEVVRELGLRGRNPYDLERVTSPDAVQLGSLQAVLVLRRLISDLGLLASTHEASVTSKSFPPQVSALPTSAESLVRDKGTRPRTDGARIAAIDQGSFVGVHALARQFGTSISPISNAHADEGGADSCAGILGAAAPSNREDAIALGTTFAFGQLAVALGIESVLNVTGLANVLLAYTRLVASVAAMEAVVSLTTGGALIRTKTRDAGQRGTLEAALRLNPSVLPMLNCYRRALNVMGLDFKILPAGPLVGADVEWVMVEGGTSVDTKGDYSITPGIVEFVPDRSSITGKLSGRTDEYGKTSMDIQGAAQQRVIPDNAAPVQKQFKVRLNVAIEPPELGSTALDAGGIFVGGVVALVNLPVELVLKTNWVSSRTFTFPVIDWEDCRLGAWSGLITYETDLEDKSVHTPRPGETRLWRESRRQSALFVLNDKPMSDPVSDLTYGTSPIFHRTIKARTSQAVRTESASKTIRSRQQTCNSRGTLIANVNEERITTHIDAGTASGAATVSVTMDDDGSYTIGAHSDQPMTHVVEDFDHQKTTISIEWCQPSVNRVDGPSISSVEEMPITLQMEGKLDSPARTALVGKREETSDLNGREVTTWSLRLCQ